MILVMRRPLRFMNFPREYSGYYLGVLGVVGICSNSFLFRLEKQHLLAVTRLKVRNIVCTWDRNNINTNIYNEMDISPNLISHLA